MLALLCYAWHAGPSITDDLTVTKPIHCTVEIGCFINSLSNSEKAVVLQDHRRVVAESICYMVCLLFVKYGPSKVRINTVILIEEVALYGW